MSELTDKLRKHAVAIDTGGYEPFAVDDLNEAADEIERLEKLVEEMRKALEIIESWWPEFPATGKFWDNVDGTPSDRPMSYGATNGSNGERDYMRDIARQAISKALP